MARATCSREKAAEPSVCVCVLVCYSVYVYMHWCPVFTHCCAYCMHVLICTLVDMSCVCRYMFLCVAMSGFVYLREGQRQQDSSEEGRANVG